MTQAKVTKEKKDKDAPPTKVVIRRLPPSLTKEEFLEQISPVPEHDYYQFVGPDKSLGQSAFCRAYIHFGNHEDLSIFCEKFDGYVFVDSKGNEFSAVVEYAPFQKVPKKKKRSDTKKGTIEQDSDYIKFLEQLENPDIEPAPPIEKYIEEIETREKECKANHGVIKVSTPLLDYLKKRKDDKKAARQRAIEDRKRREVERRKQREEERRKRREREKEKELQSREKDAKKEKRADEGEGQVKILKKTERRDSDGERNQESSRYSSTREGKYNEDDHRETKSPTKEGKFKSGRDREKDWGKRERDREPRRREERDYKDSKEYKDSRYSSRDKGPSRGAESKGGSYRREKRDDRREWDDRKDRERDKDRKREKDYDREPHRRDRDDRRDKERDYDREHHYEREKKEYTGRFASGRDSKPRKPSYVEQKERSSGGKSDSKHSTEKGGGDTTADAGKSDSSVVEKEISSPKKDTKPARFSAMRAKEKEARDDSRASKDDKDKAETTSGDSSRGQPVKRVRNKDRPERAIYVPGRRAAEKRKEEERKKEGDSKEKEVVKSVSHSTSDAKDAES